MALPLWHAAQCSAESEEMFSAAVYMPIALSNLSDCSSASACSRASCARLLRMPRSMPGASGWPSLAARFQLFSASRGLPSFCCDTPRKYHICACSGAISVASVHSSAA